MRKPRAVLGTVASIALILALGIPTAAHGENSDGAGDTSPERQVPFMSDTEPPPPATEEPVPDEAPYEDDPEPVEPPDDTPAAPEPGPDSDPDPSLDDPQTEVGEEDTADAAIEEERLEATERTDDVITPLATQGQTDIVITKVGDRTGSGLTAGSPVSGATFTAYQSTGTGNGRTPDLSAPRGSCVTGPSGQCTITVSNQSVTGTGSNRGVWIIETSSPVGWNMIATLGTGNYDGAKTALPYRFFMPITGTNTSNPQTIQAPSGSTFPSQTKSGAWVNPRVNSTFPTQCGLSVAMMFDTSASIDADEMELMKDAAKSFLAPNALGGTPSTVAMFRFSTSATRLAPGNFDLLTPGNASSGYLGAQALIDNALPSVGSDYTNWDAAFQLLANSEPFDIVMFVTDGDPTAYGVGTVSMDLNVNMIQVEQAVLSANTLKARVGPAGGNTKVLGIGIGLSTNSFYNLQAVTGPTAGVDYFLGNFASLQHILQDIATANCGGTLTVVKELRDPQGATIDDSAPGWEFTAAGASVSGGNETRVTGDLGTTFELQFAGNETVPVTMTETAQNGFELEEVTCNGAPVSPTDLSVTVHVNRQTITSCTFVNRQIPASVEVAKTWEIVDGAGTVLRTIHEPSTPGDDSLPAGLSAALTLTGPDTGSDPTEQAWGTAREGFNVGATTSVDESVTINEDDLPNCTLTSKAITSIDGTVLADPLPLPHSVTVKAGNNTLGITNTVTCVTTLTLLKSVDGGSASSSEWNLSATDGTTNHTVAGNATASASNTFEITAGTEYELSESFAHSDAVIAYRFERLERCDASGDTCTWTTVDPTHAVSVDLGQHATYRFVNVAVPPIGLPLTGGLGSDWLQFAGLLTVLIAATGAMTLVVVKRRRDT